jgi:predicted HD phosphohydrolase
MTEAGISRSLQEATSAQVAAVLEAERQAASGLVDRLLDEVRMAANVRTLNISLLAHSLQTATRAYRDNASDEMVVAALLHDIGDSLAPLNHGELVAAILRPYVSDEIAWTIQVHPILQRQYYADQIGEDWSLPDDLRSSPHLPTAIAFCRDWDQCSFDPDYDTLPLSHFEPIVRRVFARA